MFKGTKAFTIVLALAVFVCGPAFADKPDSPGNSGKHDSPASGASHSGDKHGDENSQYYFDDQRMALIRDYFYQAQASGNCPPGLAKKNNGCQPPGQAKKWQRGERFPPELVYYDLPSALLHELGRTPEGQKIIRVGTAVLLINAATGLIVDVFED